ncbi:hypothetical protein D9756_008704 [Leucocoprinus leucothites]|uniref:Phospholipase/carboxylesterase/thioesterase domain-containing protein n=1 Tax=Leucocoprinus leucothites TaxID=201217 RepID=A0A8H5CYW6_9AGAR|nr:hypothetical protein D9756_008704 [Leucoagaricus leucothites]
MASSVGKELHVRETAQEVGDPTTSNPRVKPSPKSGNQKIPVPFSYIPSDDGTDENLLILIHGLGDTHVPFAKMGKQLKLPQTAVLALRAPEQIPFLYEEAYQWYTSFDPLGELITSSNPTPAIQLLDKVVTHLTTECKWPLNRIHWFGFAQGGSVVAEFGLWWWKEKQLLPARKALPSTAAGNTTTAEAPTTSFGSITTISGPLLSFPSSSTHSPTPVLAISRPRPSELAFSANDISAFKRGFRVVKEVKYENPSGGMPVGKAEWEPVMRFWSERLEKRVGDEAGLYEVLSGSL